MNHISSHKIMKVFRSIRIILLLFPFLTIFKQVEQWIYSTANFILIITLIIFIYLAHEFHFNQPLKQKQTFKYLILEEFRKITACMISSYLIALLICQVYDITVNIYTVQYGEQIVLWFRVIVTLSNVEANMQLCDKKHRKHINSVKQNL